MAAKRIRISTDNSTFSTLPGKSGTLSNSGNTVDDTVFGQNYESGFTALIDWSVTTDPLIKSIAGYSATIYQGGSSTTMTDEATTVSGVIATITDSTRRLIDINVAVVVKDGATVVNTGYTIDYLFGRIIFDSAPSGAVTVTAAFLPLGVIAKAKSISIAQTAATIDETDYANAKTEDGYKTPSYGLKTVSASLGGIYATTNAWLAALQNRNTIVVAIDLEGNSNSQMRGFFRVSEQSQSGNVGALEEETVQLTLSVPDNDLLAIPMSWRFTSGSTVNSAIQNCLTAWLDASALYVQYLPDGTTGLQGEVLVTSIGFDNKVEGLNTFSLTLSGVGKPAVVS